MALEKLVSSDTTSLNQHFGDWRQAITCAGELLERAGCIEHSYTEHMVELVQQMGPYIVVMPGVALAHARPQGDVHKNSIAMVTATEGVSFGNPANDPVYTIFAIAARTDEEHLELFQEVARFIGEEKNLEALRTASTFEEIPVEGE